MDYLFDRIDCKNHDLQFIHDQTGLSESSINYLIKQQKKSPEDIAALNILLQSVNFQNALPHVNDYIKAVNLHAGLKEIRKNQVKSEGSDYTPNTYLLQKISDTLRDMELQEYKLDTNFRFAIQELRETAKDQKE